MGLNPLPVGTLVDYRGSQSHGRYIVTGHQDPRDLFSVKEMEQITGEYPAGLAEVYPDGIAYTIWREGIEQRFGNRMYMITRVRRGSLTPVEAPGWEYDEGGEAY
jgi:hypothetical protein